MFVGDAAFTKDGEDADSFSSGGVLKASANIYYCDNENEGNMDTTLMMIVFDRDGKIVDIGLAPKAAKKNGLTPIDVSVDLTGKNCSGGSAEVYLWDSVKNMHPLADAIILN